MKWDKETVDFIKACMKVNKDVKTDVAFRAFKIVQQNLRVKLPDTKEAKDD